MVAGLLESYAILGPRTYSPLGIVEDAGFQGGQKPAKLWRGWFREVTGSYKFFLDLDLLKDLPHPAKKKKN